MTMLSTPCRPFTLLPIPLKDMIGDARKMDSLPDNLFDGVFDKGILYECLCLPCVFAWQKVGRSILKIPFHKQRREGESPADRTTHMEYLGSYCMTV